MAAFFTVVLFSTAALADGVHQAPQVLGGGNVKTGHFKITLKGSQDAGTPNTACTGGSGLANHCPSGNCTCYSGSGTISGSSGAGTFTFYETYDVGQQVQPPDNLYQCAPFYGDLEISGSKDTESIGIFGSDCENLIAPDLPGFFDGGWFLATSSNRYQTAFGECSGPYTAVRDSSGAITAYRIKFAISGHAIKVGE